MSWGSRRGNMLNNEYHRDFPTYLTMHLDRYQKAYLDHDVNSRDTHQIQTAAVAQRPHGSMSQGNNPADKAEQVRQKTKSDETAFMGMSAYLLMGKVSVLAFHDVLDDPGTPGWFRTAAELGYDMMSRGADAETLADLMDDVALRQEGETWFLRAEKYRSGLRRLWAREKYKRERERGPMHIDPAVQREVPEFATSLIGYLRRSMLAQEFNDLQYYPPCWGHDVYDRASPQGDGLDTPSCSGSSSGTNTPPEVRAADARGHVSDPTETDPAEEDTDAAILVQKKWLLKDEDESDEIVVEVPDEEAERPGGATTATPEDTIEGPEADAAEGLWLILLGLDPYGGSLSVPADLTTMPMTLPTEIVENVRATLSEHTAEEVEEMRAALPNVLAAIKEELLGLLDEAARARSSSSRPTPVDTEPPEAMNEGDENQLMQRTVTGMLRTSKRGQGIREDKLALHQELQDFPQGTASSLARRLRRRLQGETHHIEDWVTIEAVLAANSETKEACPEGEEEAAQEEWVEKWLRRLARPRHGQPASSTDVVHVNTAPLNDTQLYEDREKEENAQETADIALYEWHQQQVKAAQAKMDDEVTLQANLGLSTRRPAKKVRLTVQIEREGTKHYSEFEINAGEEIKLGISLSEGAPGHYLHGQPVSSAEAREHLQKEESRLRAGGSTPPRTSYSMEDPATRDMYTRWLGGQATAEQVADLGGVDMVKFFEAVREIEDIQTLPDTAPPAEGQGLGPDREGPTLAHIIRLNYLGEQWKTQLANTKFQETYRAWLAGTVGDDMVVLLYGNGVMALYRLLLERGYRHIPQPTDCGSDSNSDTETVPFQPAPPAGMAREECGPDDADTLILGEGPSGEDRRHDV
ncbi:unnamed protein product [Symbiodinium microadriaticum]|nr:unnamed protein product [Symbiodinium microadriaticum]CAE7821805.1 unnamed protein product [Symbiodinium sp. KB8]